MRWPAAVSIAVALVIAGCFGSSPATRFYTLSTLAPSGTGHGASSRLVRVAPVSLPDALDRPQLVRRTGATTVSLEEFDRWIEPLDILLRNALALNLAALLPEAQVLGSSAPGLESQQTVVLAVERLDVAQELSLDAVWFVLNAGEAQPKATHRARLTESIGAGQPGDAAGALSRTVERLSRDIAADLQASPPPPPPSK